MAFVIRRGDRFEIRESTSTSRGPRATTLATFHEVSDDVLDKAASRAARPFDRVAVRRRAVDLGAPVAPSAAFVAARALVGEFAQGRRVPPALGAQLSEALRSTPSEPLDSLDDVEAWIDVTPDRRGRALWDLLELASAVPPQRRRSNLDFPRLTSTG